MYGREGSNSLLPASLMTTTVAHGVPLSLSLSLSEEETARGDARMLIQTDRQAQRRVHRRRRRPTIKYQSMPENEAVCILLNRLPSHQMSGKQASAERKIT